MKTEEIENDNTNSIFSGFKCKAGSNLTGAYVLTHTESGKVYIGSTSDFNKRRSSHIGHLKANIHGNRNLQECYNTSPHFHFKFYLTGRTNDTEARQKAFDLEQEMLDHYSGTNNLLNRSPNSRTNKGVVATEETRVKISAASKLSWANNAIRDRILTSRKTEEAITKRTLSRKALWEDPNFKTKISNSRKALWGTQEYKDKMAASRINNDVNSKISLASKKMWSDSEFKTKMSSSMLSKWDDPIFREKMLSSHKNYFKPVIIDGVRYESLKEASIATGVCETTIIGRCKNARDKYSNYAYAKEQVVTQSKRSNLEFFSPI